jgi:hypothetical protein
MSRLRSVSEKALRWIVMGFTVATALQIYYVQEMLAALILFAVLFSAVAAVLLILYVLFRAADALLEVLESSAKHALQQAREWRTLPSEPQPVLGTAVSAHVELTTSHLAPERLWRRFVTSKAQCRVPMRPLLGIWLHRDHQSRIEPATFRPRPE